MDVITDPPIIARKVNQIISINEIILLENKYTKLVRPIQNYIYADVEDVTLGSKPR